MNLISDLEMDSWPHVFVSRGTLHKVLQVSSASEHRQGMLPFLLFLLLLLLLLLLFLLLLYIIIIALLALLVLSYYYYYYVLLCFSFVLLLASFLYFSFFLKVVKHPSNVIEIQMKKSGFRMEAGQVRCV